jgi:hypothetical protein
MSTHPAHVRARERDTAAARGNQSNRQGLMGARSMNLTRKVRSSRVRVRAWLVGVVAVLLIGAAAGWTAPALANPFSLHTLSFGSALTDPGGLAVDSAGDLFATNFSPVSGSVVELRVTRSGGYSSPTVLPFGGTLDGAIALAVDRSGDVFVANETAGTVVELPARGSGHYGPPITLPFGIDLNGPDGIATDSAGDLFVANFDAGDVVELLSAAHKLAPGQSRVIVLPFGTLDGPAGVAVDTAGDVFTTSDEDNTVVELRANSSGGYEPPIALRYGGALNMPSALAIDPAGDLFISSANSGTVVELPANGAGGYGAPITLPFGGSLSYLPSVAVDAAGQVFALPDANTPGSAVELSPSAPIGSACKLAAASSPQCRSDPHQVRLRHARRDPPRSPAPTASSRRQDQAQPQQRRGAK